MAAKYQEYYDKMLEQNRHAFEEFEIIHNKYAMNRSELQEEFNEKGDKILKIIREWEDKLCGHSEGSGYGSYSGNLADKFWGRVRKDYPEIDSVGIVVFKIKKISPKK
jgi:hypothetical protein